MSHNLFHNAEFRQLAESAIFEHYCLVWTNDENEESPVDPQINKIIHICIYI